MCVGVKRDVFGRGDVRGMCRCGGAIAVFVSMKKEGEGRDDCGCSGGQGCIWVFLYPLIYLPNRLKINKCIIPEYKLTRFEESNTSHSLYTHTIFFSLPTSKKKKKKNIRRSSHFLLSSICRAQRE